MSGYQLSAAPRRWRTLPLIQRLAILMIVISHGSAFTSPLSRIRYTSSSLTHNYLMNTSKRRTYQSGFLWASTLEETGIKEADVITKPTSQPSKSYDTNEKEPPTLSKSASARTKQKTPEIRSSDNTEKVRAVRSKQRMLKAQKLLEMAQVSPSQRLEMEEERRGANSTSFSATGSRLSAAPGRFNNTEDMYQMRMAGTFDSVDNLVDSKSLLPDGRWVEERKRSTENTDAPSSEMELRNKLAAGQVAEVCFTYTLSMCVVLEFQLLPLSLDLYCSH